MPKIKVTQRAKSPGELAEEKRLARYWSEREAKQRPGQHPNRNTMAIRPPRFEHIDSGWAVENE